MKVPACKCGTCKACIRREQRRFAEFELPYVATPANFNGASSSVNQFILRDFYMGRLPKCGRVMPKPALS